MLALLLVGCSERTAHPPTTVAATTTLPPTTTTDTSPPPTEPPPLPSTLPPPAPPAPDRLVPPPAPAPANLAGQIAALTGRTWNATLANIASNWAEFLASTKTISHQNLFQFLNGWSALGENIWTGPPGTTAGQIIAAWQASPPHAAQLADRSFWAIGVGCAVNGDFKACVADFGK